MEFLKNQFDFEGRKRRNRGRVLGRDDHYDMHDDYDEHHDDDYHDHYPGNQSQASRSNPVMPSTGLICARCSTQLVQGAKFCHQCG